MKFTTKQKIIGGVLTYVAVNVLCQFQLERIERLDRKKKAEERKREFDLDMLAIERTSAIITKRSIRGTYQYSHEIELDFNQELEFQKIAVREDTK